MASHNDSRKGRKSKDEIGDQLVTVNRITKVVKGGRGVRFAALVVVGDKKGHVGFGTGKAQEVPETIRKAVEVGKKNMTSVPTVGTTVPHEVISHFGSGNILLKLAGADSSVAAGGTVCIVIDVTGIADITSKSFDSSTPINVVRATIDGLKELRTHEDVLKLRESTKSLQD